jgi:G:T-mismatch repair DNA endonuclease (very short patch repair protein)
MKKLGGNARRDKLNWCALVKLGWRVVVVWECEAERADVLHKKINRLDLELKGATTAG